MRQRYPLLSIDWKNKKLVLGPSAGLVLFSIVLAVKGIAIPQSLVQFAMRWIK
jgi:hypothetical protein